jgi:hypothetical protein
LPGRRLWNLHDFNNKFEFTLVVRDSQQTEIALNHAHKFYEIMVAKPKDILFDWSSVYVHCYNFRIGNQSDSFARI